MMRDMEDGARLPVPRGLPRAPLRASRRARLGASHAAELPQGRAAASTVSTGSPAPSRHPVGVARAALHGPAA